VNWLMAVLLVAALGGAAPPRTHTVEIRGMEFHPAELTVAPGDTVVWINHDFVAHDITEEHKAWNSSPLAAGASWKRAGGTAAAAACSWSMATVTFSTISAGVSLAACAVR